MQQSLFPDDTAGNNEPAEGFDTNALNEAQQAAVTHGQGPVLVIAGAGSGKTRTLVYRMAFLIEQGVAPESILLLTFTRRAAQEMLWRASRLTDQACRRIVGGTFHATSNMLLRRHGHHLGLGSGFTIIDRGDAEGIINLLKSSLGLAGKGKRFPSKRIIMNLLSGQVNKNRSLEDLVLDHHAHLAEFIDDFRTIRRHYTEFKLEHGLLDYDDLLVFWHRLLAESGPARDEICSRFSHILVDEYQDTNLIQAEIVRLLAHGHDNVMVVGDDAQSIYSFRGADFHNIMRFPRQFPGARIIKLEENYRSTQPILSLTNAIIASATEKFTKTLFTRTEGGSRPKVVPARNDSAEARFVADKIADLRQQGTPIAEMAVLFRSGFHSFKLELELNSRGIAFEKRGGLKLTESAHIKDVLSFLRILINPWDNLSWNRILLQLDKVGQKTAQRVLAVIGESDDPIAALAAYKAPPGWRDGLALLNEALARIRQPGLTPASQFDAVMVYYEPIFEKIYYDDYPKRRKDLDQVRTLIGGYGDLQSFIDDTALDPPEAETAAALTGDDEEGRLILSTIHSAKGLEWDVVFVIGLAEGRFPQQRTEPGEQWEEERRLLYVAATRARKQLYLTYPRQIMTPDRKLWNTGMSPFLQEISPGLYELGSSPASSAGMSHAIDRLTIPARTPRSARVEFARGMQVRHPLFGPGTVRSIPGPRRVEIHFDRHGDKTLHLDYAKLEIIG